MHNRVYSLKRNLKVEGIQDDYLFYSDTKLQLSMCKANDRDILMPLSFLLRRSYDRHVSEDSAFRVS